MLEVTFGVAEFCTLKDMVVAECPVIVPFRGALHGSPPPVHVACAACAKPIKPPKTTSNLYFFMI